MNPAIAACVILFLASALPASAQNFGGRPFLSVQGHAEAKVKPDLFPLTATLRDLGMDAAKSQDIVETLAAKVLEAAKANGVAEKDIEVGNLDISPETEWDDDKDVEVFKGNKYERQITLRFRSLPALRHFIESMPMSRNLRLGTGQFQYSGAAELKRKLRREAIADARKGAQDMAAAVDKRLLDLFNVSDRAQSTIYAASGYNSETDTRSVLTNEQIERLPLGHSAEAIALLAPGEIVLREGEITVSADAFLVYLIGD